MISPGTLLNLWIINIMMNGNKFKQYLLTGGLTLALPLATFAQERTDTTTQADTIKNANDSLVLARSVIESLSNQISSNQNAIQSLESKGLIVSAILFALILIIGVLTLMLVHAKVHHKRRGANRFLTQDEFRTFNNDVLDDSTRKNQDIEKIKSRLNIIEKDLSDLHHRHDFEEVSDKKSKQDKAQQQKPSKQTQYLKANNEGDFFFEGSNNSDGCQFKITFTSKVNGSNGNLTVIANIENLKGIPAVFLKKAVHVLNNVSLKEARSFTVVHEGICEYQQEGDFGTWMIKKPIDVQLRK